LIQARGGHEGAPVEWRRRVSLALARGNRKPQAIKHRLGTHHTDARFHPS